MNYKSLYKLWLEERNSPSLQEIPADFYISMDGYLSNLYQKLQNIEWQELANVVIERMEFLRRDLTQLRLSKIVKSTIHNIPINPAVLTWSERRLIKDLKKSIEMLGFSPSSDLSDDFEVSLNQSNENDTDLFSPQEKLMIRMLTDVDPFVGVDNKNYGPLMKYDIVNLPVENARALIAKGVARVIDINIKF